MRVLDFNNHYSEIGGGVRVYHHEKLRYVRERANFAACLIVPSDREDWQEEGNCVRAHIPAVPLGKSGYRIVWNAAALKRAIERFAPDIIELGSAEIAPLVLRLASPGMPIVGFYHSDDPATVWGPLGRRIAPAVGDVFERVGYRYFREVYAGLSGVLAASNNSERALARAGAQRIWKTPLGVDPVMFSWTRRDEGLRRDLLRGREKLVVFVGRFAKEKGFDVLLRSLDSLGGNVRVVAMGRGPLMDEAIALQRRGLLTVLPFAREQEAVARLFASADLAVSPGPYETFSLATLEALACGVRVVAASSGGAAELVAAVDGGRLFTAGREFELASAVRDLLCESHRSQELSERVAKRYSWTACFDRVFDVYSEAIRAE